MQSCSRFLEVSSVFGIYLMYCGGRKIIQLTWFIPGLGFFDSGLQFYFTEILEVPDVVLWRWSHMITLEVKWNKENNLFIDFSPTEIY
ncbi:hypothetical protein OUZ56_025252 [Daphnia magna]|uniref:Uncharacterized protein n=1 Tax=Daphnia magna TaxID=35525 RepID=A0ABQ9ZJA6_9CRUS|nr:hypothetical protein OUZ56_025252 [Daphnia magna]